MKDGGLTVCLTEYRLANLGTYSGVPAYVGEVTFPLTSTTMPRLCRDA